MKTNVRNGGKLLLNRRAFTLIELLAVIVILAIIALIATPIILNIINNSKVSANERSAELYVTAVEQAIARKNLDGEFNPSTCEIANSVVTCDGEELNVEVTGEKPTSGTILFENGSVKSGTTLNFAGFTATVNANNKIEIGEAVPTPVSFAVDDWSTIVANVQAGNLSAYNVGDEKEVTLTGEVAGTYTVRIANTSTPEECSTEGFSQTACGFVIEFVDIITTHAMNSTATNEGGWETSEMRTYVNGTIYDSFPEELKNSIINTTVVSGHGSTSGEVNFTTTDKLYFLATKEVWGKEATTNVINYDSAEVETRQLDYYKNYKNADGSIGVTTSSYSGAIKKYNGSANTWWLRSAYSGNTSSFHNVHAGGYWSNSNAYNTYGVAVSFRLG